MKNVNYTPEITSWIVEAYNINPSMDTVRALAEEHGKTTKSIIGKLSREGVYQKASYTTKTGAKPITKAEIVAQIVDKLQPYSEHDNLEQTVAGLEKAPKAALVAVRDAVEGLYDDQCRADEQCITAENTMKMLVEEGDFNTLD